MKGRKVIIRTPIAEDLESIAETEDMNLEDLVDYVLRRYLEDWELEDDEDGGDSDSEEDLEESDEMPLREDG